MELLKKSLGLKRIFLFVVLLYTVQLFGQNEGLYTVSDNRQYGFIDKTGKMVIQPQYDYAAGFSEGLAHIKMQGKRGFIDKTGKIVIEPKYTRVMDFSDGLAAVNPNH